MARLVARSRRGVRVTLYLLDTNVFAALSQPRPQRAVERAFAEHTGEIVTASVVVHEMWFGIERMPRSRRRAELERFMVEIVAPLRVLVYGERAAKYQRHRMNGCPRLTAARRRRVARGE